MAASVHARSLLSALPVRRYSRTLATDAPPPAHGQRTSHATPTYAQSIARIENSQNEWK